MEETLRKQEEEAKEIVERSQASHRAQLEMQDKKNKNLMAALKKKFEHQLESVLWQQEKSSLLEEREKTRASYVAQIEEQSSVSDALLADLKKAEQQLESHLNQWKEDKLSLLQATESLKLTQQEKEQEWERTESTMRSQLVDLQSQIMKKQQKKKWGGHVEKQEKQQKNEKIKPKVRRHHTSKSDEPDLHESAFLKKIIAYQRKLLNYFARNFYNMRMLALFVAFAINFILLFYKVSTSSSVVEEREVVYTSSQAHSSVQWDPLGGEAMETKEEVMDEAGEPLKPVTVRFVLEESSGYMEPMLRILAVMHTREKEVARKLEFDGLYITEQPSEDDIKGQWDRLVINTQSFPNNYWDKFVKRKVMDKYGEFYGHDRISELLGMDKAALDFSDSHKKRKPRRDSSLAAVLNSIDVKYQIWKLGVVFTDNSFLYLAWYMTMSILGHYNNFFFAAHLLDIAMGFKTLRTILSSVTHNGKQLVLTVGLLAVVVYLYTVVAFNFFRKFYNKSEDGELPDMKCDDMLTCYMFHMYVGVRAGGGIGDQIEDPAGDEYEIYRIIFDITFFFFVIVILLAIIQGLIIDAFGELRDQQEQVKEDMETKCFICGIGNDYFDTVPHGFETHTLQEHNLANYLFFVMYLINKDETEHTGQESYVWKMYQERCWEFFPAGDCFRKQYEDQLN
ncbi:hypothetical protein EPR50_G00218870 [Perca flavescens]|uniref:Ion transport domain-containing protein n=1 Tax=Perca flavescens TaxID=8167 RepID=A0A484C9T4_PERFV|nr:hypothetical protein EPR50_G00218870 [Perca flavescens]